MPDATKRLFLRVLGRFGLLGGGMVIGEARAHHTETHLDDASAHRIVYQCNKADPEYIGHVLFSVAELIRKYGDDVEIVVAAFGPGLQLLGRHPTRPIPPELRDRAASLAQYGVAFHACGNTMSALHWMQEDLVDFARIVPIGVDDVMQLQERGFSYLSW